MDHIGLIHKALQHVEQAAFALSRDVTEDDLAAAMAELDQVRNLLSTAAFHEAEALRGGRAVPEGDADETPALTRRLPLDGDPRASAAARSFTGSTCDAWRVPAAAKNAAVDLASELVSNAARHAGGPIELALERRGRHVLVSVSDRSPAPPRLLPYRPGVSEQGIGLRIVDQLSDSWGWVAIDHGKRVWARAALSRDLEWAPSRGVPASRRMSASDI
jgi:hypothetical protein